MPAQTQILVKHLIFNKAEAKTCRGMDYLPLYLQIEAFNEQILVKSQMHEYLLPYVSDVEVSLGKDREMSSLVMQGYFSPALFEQINQLSSFPLHNLLNAELKLVRLIVSHLKKINGRNFSLDSFSEKYRLYSADISSILDRNIKKKYYTELRKVFEKQLNDKKNPRAYKVSNFFLHFIRWDNDFYSIYENCYEIMPGELKFLENYFSRELNDSIKAYLSYQPRANVFKNMFGRQEMGEITRLTYLDWLNVKKLLLEEFEKIFGTRTAKEYIDILGNILESELTAV